MAASVSKFCFIKFIGNKFISSLAQIFANFFGYFWNRSIVSKLLWLHFGQLLDRIWLIFIPTSAHTGGGGGLHSCLTIRIWICPRIPTCLPNGRQLRSKLVVNWKKVFDGFRVFYFLIPPSKHRIQFILFSSFSPFKNFNNQTFIPHSRELRDYHHHYLCCCCCTYHWAQSYKDIFSVKLCYASF